MRLLIRMRVWSLLPLVFLLPLIACGMCPSSCECDDEKLRVVCVGGKLDIVPNTLNPRLRHLVLRDSEIGSLLEGSLSFYPELLDVDLSGNGLNVIGDRAWSEQNALRSLDLSRNQIAEVSERTFLGLSNLTSLDLSHNKLTTLPELSMSFSRRLAVLNLKANFISSLPPRLLPRDLQRLVLRSNPIALNSLTAILSNAPRLEALDIGQCGLTTLNEQMFEGNPRLSHLKLDGNQMTSLSPRLLSHLSSLKHLHLGDNAFQTLATRSFKGLEKLVSLDLSNMGQLVKVEPYAFHGLHQLQRLTMNFSTALRTLEKDSLRGMPKLAFLSLHSSALTNIDEEAMLMWGDLKKLDLMGCPLHCGCQQVWLHKLLLSFNDSSPLCHSPPEVHDLPLATLTQAQMGCSSTSKNSLRVVLAAVCTVLGVFLLLISIAVYRYRDTLCSVFCARRRRCSRARGVPVEDIPAEKWVVYEPPIYDPFRVGGSSVGGLPPPHLHGVSYHPPGGGPTGGTPCYHSPMHHSTAVTSLGGTSSRHSSAHSTPAHAHTHAHHPYFSNGYKMVPVTEL